MIGVDAIVVDNDKHLLSEEKLAIAVERLEQNYDPKCELESGNPYQFLVSIILSAQATDKSVNAATPDLFAIAPSPATMLDLGEEKLREHISSIGLYRNKAKNIIAMSTMLNEKFDGAVPSDYDSLIALPGVGRKSAHVFMNSMFGADVVAVDTHVFRLSHRLGISKGKTPIAVERDIVEKIPPPARVNISHLLVLHGRYVCKAKKPECASCVLRDLCPRIGVAEIS